MKNKIFNDEEMLMLGAFVHFGGKTAFDRAYSKSMKDEIAKLANQIEETCEQILKDRGLLG